MKQGNKDDGAGVMVGNERVRGCQGKYVLGRRLGWDNPQILLRMKYYITLLVPLREETEGNVTLYFLH